MTTYIVVPTNRPERMRSFARSWGLDSPPVGVQWLIVEDAPQRTLTLPNWALHLSHFEIDRDYAEVAALIPRRSGGIRNIGFWIAGHDPDCELVISLDDDCLPEAHAGPPNLYSGPAETAAFVAGHRAALELPRATRWWPTVNTRVRGFPYGAPTAQAVVNHGLWWHVPDLDAVTQLGNPAYLADYDRVRPSATESRPVPKGYYFPFCIMNVAARRDWAPFLFMPPLPAGMERWDDMWAGLLLKCVADHCGAVVTNGAPVIWHDRASDPMQNLRREFLGYGLHEQLWRVIDECHIPLGMAPIAAYRQIAQEIGRCSLLLREAAAAMVAWAEAWLKHPASEVT